jgi:atypical dual specificity phosphatase
MISGDIDRLLWWAIDGVLAGMPMPYVSPERRMNLGGSLDEYVDELALLHRVGIRAVVCLLNAPSDHAVFTSAGFKFQCCPIGSGLAPSLKQAREIVKFIDLCRRQRLPVAVHCEGGLGRTGTAIAAYLIHKGMSAREAIAFVRSKEPSAIETVQQIKFLEEFERDHP